MAPIYRTVPEYAVGPNAALSGKVEESPNTLRGATLVSEFREQYITGHGDTNSLKREANHYFNQRCTDMESGPLQYWKEEQNNISNLGSMACNYFACTSSFTPLLRGCLVLLEKSSAQIDAVNSKTDDAIILVLFASNCVKSNGNVENNAQDDIL